MERRHVAAAAAAVAALVLVGSCAALAAGTLKWRLAAHGAGGPGGPKPSSLLALNRVSARKLAARLPAAGRQALGRVNFARTLAVGVFGDFGCADGRIQVSSVTANASGRILRIHLFERTLPPGVMECAAIFPTYRLLTLAKGQFSRLPSNVGVTLS